MIISLFVDNKDSWIVPYALRLKGQIEKRGHTVFFVDKVSEIKKGDLAFFLSCETIVPRRELKKNIHNLVVHESDLPKGKGWSPLTWQILEGKNKIPITLSEAVERVDAGNIYLRDFMRFNGDEVLDELHKVQGEKTIELILKFVDDYPPSKSQEQTGKGIFYRRRTPEDSEIDINKTIKDQFNLLRVVDNERFPAFFRYKKKKYMIKIYKR